MGTLEAKRKGERINRHTKVFLLDFMTNQARLSLELLNNN